MKESVECQEEGLIKERSNEEEIVQNRPIEDTQKERIQQSVEWDKGKQVECNGERLHKRQQQEGTV